MPLTAPSRDVDSTLNSPLSVSLTSASRNLIEELPLLMTKTFMTALTSRLRHTTAGCFASESPTLSRLLQPPGNADGATLYCVDFTKNTVRFDRSPLNRLT